MSYWDQLRGDLIVSQLEELLRRSRVTELIEEQDRRLCDGCAPSSSTSPATPPLSHNSNSNSNNAAVSVSPTASLNQSIADRFTTAVRVRYTCKLEDILDQDDLLQECKALNTELIAFLTQRDVMHRMIDYIIGNVPCTSYDLTNLPDADAKIFKYSYLCCEVFCVDMNEILGPLSRDDELLLHLFSYLRKPFSLTTKSAAETPQCQPSRRRAPHLDNYFLKTMISLCRFNYFQIQEFIQAHPSFVENLVENISIPGMSILLLRLMGFRLCISSSSSSSSSSSNNNPAVNNTVMQNGYSNFESDFDEWLYAMSFEAQTSHFEIKNEVESEEQLCMVRCWWIENCGIIDILVSKFEKLSRQFVSGMRSDGVPSDDDDIATFAINIFGLLSNLILTEEETSSAESSETVVRSIINSNNLRRLVEIILSDKAGTPLSTAGIPFLIKSVIRIREYGFLISDLVVSQIQTIADELRNHTQLPSLEAPYESKQRPPPLGESRLMLIDLVGSIIHFVIYCENEPISLDRASKVMHMEDAIISSDIIGTICILFFQYALNTMLHNVVLRVMHSVVSRSRETSRNIAAEVFTKHRFLDRIVSEIRLAEGDPTHNAQKSYLAQGKLIVAMIHRQILLSQRTQGQPDSADSMSCSAIVDAVARIEQWAELAARCSSEIDHGEDFLPLGGQLPIGPATSSPGKLPTHIDEADDFMLDRESFLERSGTLMDPTLHNITDKPNDAGDEFGFFDEDERSISHWSTATALGSHISSFSSSSGQFDQTTDTSSTVSLSTPPLNTTTTAITEDSSEWAKFDETDFDGFPELVIVDHSNEENTTQKSMPNTQQSGSSSNSGSDDGDDGEWAVFDSNDRFQQYQADEPTKTAAGSATAQQSSGIDDDEFEPDDF